MQTVVHCSGGLLRRFYYLLTLIFLCGLSANAGEVRAQWLTSSRLLYKLSPGTYIGNSINFFLYDGNLSHSKAPSAAHDTSLIRLPLISLKQDEALLDTSKLSLAEIKKLITRELKVVLKTSSHQILESSPIQYSGLLDDQFYYDGNDLGGNCSTTQLKTQFNSHCSLKLWAPTAQRVRLFLFSTATSPLAQAQIKEMTSDQQGTWSLSLPSESKNSYYLYEVTVYQPTLDRVETHLVTDPYSKSLSVNSTRSQLIDWNDTWLLPPDWNSFQKPLLNSLKESVIYELHIRDFSANDTTLPESLRGTYLAFTEKHSQGMVHLKALADAGLTHLHLLPFSDSGSVNEDKTTWENDIGPTSSLNEPQSILGRLRAKDPFNWGYDPVHTMTPEGGYASRPEGGSRVLEVRQMVKAINDVGLRIVQDVVLNHTYENGIKQFSVYDKIVPLYYYRVDDLGQTFTSSCCFDTASEHRMMEKLMIDSVLHWAKNYKIDGFRFDLMSFHSHATMERIRQSLGTLTLEKDGVDGSKILIFGEGWSFGSFYERFPTEAMTLESSYGTGIGFFNDRLRDAVRGGTTNSSEKSDQGFATGLYYSFNHDPANRNTPSDSLAQKNKLLQLGDVIKAGLAGNLRDFPMKDSLGKKVHAGDLRFRGSPVAVAAQALETINYVSAHDGYTLWDAVLAKAPFYEHPARAGQPEKNSGKTTGKMMSNDDRQRMHQLALAIPLLGQGIPFIEGGSEILRSKNGDQDSYDSGDFFNRIDWTETTNYWGEGLPPAWKNIADWPFWEPRLLHPKLQVSSELISKTNKYVSSLLRLRKSSELFHLNTLNEISRQLSFIDNENAPEPGLIAMLLQNQNESLIVIFNASHGSRIFQNRLLKNGWSLHPLLDERADQALSTVAINQAQGTIRLPGRSTVVLKSHLPQRTQL